MPSWCQISDPFLPPQRRIRHTLRQIHPGGRPRRSNQSFVTSVNREAPPGTCLIPHYLQLDWGVQLGASADFILLPVVSTRRGWQKLADSGRGVDHDVLSFLRTRQSGTDNKVCGYCVWLKRQSGPQVNCKTVIVRRAVDLLRLFRRLLNFTIGPPPSLKCPPPPRLELTKIAFPP